MDISSSRWRIAAVIVLVIAIAVGFLWLQATFSIGDELLMDLRANQTEFTVNTGQNISFPFDLSVDIPWTCKATCELKGFGPDGLFYSEDVNFSRDLDTSRTLTMSARGVGRGTTIYTISATCYNNPSFLCPTQSSERSHTLLTTVHTTLAPKDAKLQELLRNALHDAGVTHAWIVQSLQWQQDVIEAYPLIHSQDIRDDISSLSAQSANLSLLLSDARALWSQERYSQADTIPFSSQAQLLLTLTSDTEARLGTRLEIYNLSVVSAIAAVGDAQRAIAEFDRFLPADNVINETEVLASMFLIDTPVDIILHEAENLRNASASYRRSANVERDRILVLGCGLGDCAQPADITQICTDISNRYSEAETLVQTTMFNGTADGAENMSNATLLPVDTSTPTTMSVSANESSYAAIALLQTARSDFLARYCSASQRNLSQTASVEKLQSLLVTSLPDRPELEEDDDLLAPRPTCCVFGSCRQCCEAGECRDAAQYPVILVHGHAVSAATTPEYSLGGYFTEIQRRLQSDGYLDIGVVTPATPRTVPGLWGASGRPVVARVSYYYNSYSENGTPVLVTQKTEDIDTYVVRLDEMIRTLKANTGQEKVHLVGYSMGGLVVRRYAQVFGEEGVASITTIGTPNGGTRGRVKWLCPVLGDYEECEDMAADSVFLRKINDPTNEPAIPVTAVYGVGCDTNGGEGDGIVEAVSAKLPFATNVRVEGKCTDFLGTDMHIELLNIKTYPQVYDAIKMTISK